MDTSKWGVPETKLAGHLKMHIDLTTSAAEQIAQLASGTVTARALLEAYVVQHEAQNEQLNAIVRNDLDRARADASEIDQRRRRGEKIGPLEGLPMTIKDSIDVNGLPAVCGVPALMDRDATVADAAVVARLRAAGAVIWGKTNTPEMAGDIQTYNKVYGVTSNPIDPSRTPGGSSGGAAAALAAHMTPFEVGSDLAGSLRNPAHFCGVCALRPTWGLLPMKGHVPPTPRFSDAPPLDIAVVGPMARTVADLRLLMDVLSDGAVAATTPAFELSNLRAAVWSDAPGFLLSSDYRAALDALGGALWSSGARMANARPEIDLGELSETFLDLLSPIILSEVPRPAKAVLRALRPGLRLMAGKKNYNLPAALAKGVAPAHEIERAQQRRDRMKEACDRFFEHHDILIAPVTPTSAPPHNNAGLPYGRTIAVDGQQVEYFHQLDWNALASTCHLPVAVIPVGTCKDGLPLGVQLIGAEGSDEKTLRVAEAIESALTSEVRAEPAQRPEFA
jgi:amidase